MAIADFEFEIIETGEHIFVETSSVKNAYEILDVNGISKDEVEFCGYVSPELADILGYDTY